MLVHANIHLDQRKALPAHGSEGNGSLTRSCLCQTVHIHSGLHLLLTRSLGSQQPAFPDIYYLSQAMGVFGAPAGPVVLAYGLAEYALSFCVPLGPSFLPSLAACLAAGLCVLG